MAITATPSLSDNTTSSVPATPALTSSAAGGPRPSNTVQHAPVNMAAPTATPVGGRAFASPAMVRILLTPATPDVTPDEFERMTSAIRRIESIRLSDLPKSSKRGETVPSTSALARAGEVHITFVTSYDAGHAFLSPFNLHRQVLGVLGLAMCSSAHSVGQLERAPAALRQLHPSAMVHRVFGFDVGAARPQTMDLSNRRASGSGNIGKVDPSGDESVDEGGGDIGDGKLTGDVGPDERENVKTATADKRASNEGHAFAEKHDAGLVIFPAVRKDLKDVRFYLKTLVPNFIGDVLDGLDGFVKELQGKALETPRETLDGTSATTLSVASVKTIGANVGAAASSAASRASALFSSFSSTEDTSRKVSKGGKGVPSVSAIGPTGSGRYAKVKADYYLLVGDLWNALHTYDSCIAQLGKERALAGGQDAVWYASALEGWAVARTLVARMGGMVEEKAPCLTLPTGTTTKEKEKDRLTAEFEFAGKQWSDIAEAYSLALTIYSKCLAPASYLLDPMRSMHNDSPRDYTHPLIHATACLAYSRLLLAIWASGGWNGETFDQLLLGGVPPALAETTRPTVAVYTQHATASGIQRQDIAAPASQSLTNSSTNALKLLDQIHLYSSLAAIFGCLGFSRKESYAIQRLQALVIVLIAQGIRLQRQYGTQTSEALSTGDAAHGTMSTQVLSIGGGHGSDSVLVLALQICQTYGINVQLTPLLDMSRSHILLRASVDAKSGKRLSTPALNRSRAMWASSDHAALAQQFNSEEAQARVAAISELLEEAPFGWTEQQVAILKDTITICEMLQDKVALLFFALIMLRDFWSHLGFEEQFKLKDGIAKIMGEMEGLDKDVLLQYWGPKDILTGIELESGGRASLPSKLSFDELRKEKGEPNWAKSRSRQSGQVVKNLLVEDEQASFAVTLYNPLLIPLELESIKLELSTVGNSGPTFEPAERKGVILPPGSLHVLRLGGIVRGEGKLCVRGVRIKLPFCAERLFAFEYADGAAQKSLWKAQGELDDRWTRTKRFGLDARGSGSTGQGLQDLTARPKARAREQDSLWTLTVIAKVPVMTLKVSQPIRGGSLVLCDGEEKTVSLTLTNQSDVTIDCLRLTFDDDMQSSIVALLAEGSLDAADVYELERDLIDRPFLSEVAKNVEREDLVILPGASTTVMLRIRGKLDVCKASINIRFGNKAQSRDLGRDHLWVRQTSFSFDVRCLPALFIDGLELAPLDEEQLRRLLNNGAPNGDRDRFTSDHGSYLLSLAAHNAHPGEVEVVVDLKGALAVSQSLEPVMGSPATRCLAAHASVRLYFILPRLSPQQKVELLNREIPKLVERQFIVSRVLRTEQAERASRTGFWLRQLLLERFVGLTWTDVHTRRSGIISTAGIQIESVERTSGAIFGEGVSVDVRLQDGKGGEAQAGELHATATDFVNLIVKVDNLGPAPIHAHYRIAAADGHDGKQGQQPLCVNGHMQGLLRAPTSSSQPSSDCLLKPGARATVHTGLCFLGQGSYKLTVDVTAGVGPASSSNEVQLLTSKGITVHVH